MNKKGFSYPVLIVMLLVVFGLGLATVLVLNRYKLLDAVAPTSPVNLEEAKPTDKKTDNLPVYEPSLKEYRSDKFGFMIMYPDRFTVNDSSISIQDTLLNVRFTYEPLGKYDPVFSVEVLSTEGGPISVDTLASVYAKAIITDETVAGRPAKKIAGKTQILRNGDLVETFEDTYYVLTDTRLYLIKLQMPIVEREVSNVYNMVEFMAFYRSFELL